MSQIFKLATIALLLAIVSCYSQSCASDPKMLMQIHKDSYNNGNWGVFASTLSKDIILGGANYPTQQGRELVLKDCMAVHTTGLKSSMHWEKVNQISDSIAYASGYYLYFTEQDPTQFTEQGYYNTILKKSEDGVWQFHRLMFSVLDKEYSITPEFWRNN